jgi:hypothetical protein
MLCKDWGGMMHIEALVYVKRTFGEMARSGTPHKSARRGIAIRRHEQRYVVNGELRDPFERVHDKRLG